VSPGRVLLVVGLGTFMVFLDTTIVNIAFPDIRSDFSGADLRELSWVLNAYNIVLAALFVVFGRIADVVGRRRTYIAGVALFATASAACAIAPSVTALVAARVAQGLGGAMIVPAGLALVVRAFPQERRAHGVGLYGATAALAAGIGPSVGGLLVELSGWRLTFLVNVPVGVLAVFAARAVLIESRAAGRRALPDLLGSALLAIAIGAVALGIVKGDEWGWTSLAVAACAAVAVLAGTAVVVRSGRHRAPVLDLALLRSRDLALANGLTVTAAVALYAAMLCNVLFLTSVWGYTELKAGLAITAGPLATAIVAGPAGKLADRFGYRTVVLPGALVWVAGLAFFIARAGTRPEFVAHWLPGILLTGIGMGLVLPALNAAAVASARGTSFGTSAAINAAARQVGAVLGIALLVVVVGTPAPAQLANAFEDGWRLAAAFLLLTAAGAAALRRTRSAGDAATAPAEPTAPPAILPAAHGSGVVSRLGVPARTTARHPRDLVETLPLLQDADPATVAGLARAAQPVEVAAGEALFASGDDADAVFVVVSGRLAVIAPGEDGRTVALRARGDLVGEIAAFAGVVRPNSIVAERDSRLLRVPADVVLDAAERDTGLANRLVVALGAILTSGGANARAPVARPATVAVLPAGDGSSVEGVASALAAALARMGAVARLDAPPGKGASDHAAMVDALEDAERDHDHVLLCSGAADPADPWTAFCLGQADRVVAVAGTPATPRWATRAGCELVWVAGRRDGLPALARSLDARAICVTEPGAPAVEPLARRLAGASVGLVLAGGGARALAHIGVLDELEAAGVEIDRIAGAGTGALIGALHAAGMDADDIHGWCYEWLVRRRALAELSWPRHGILREDRLAAALVAAFGDRLIEELPRQLRCGCADLLERETVVLRAGGVAESVRASLALPGLLAPVVVGERLLVDGGMLDNLPLAALDAGEGPLVAVDITVQRARPRTAGEPLPRITETLQRALLLGSNDARIAAHATADVLVRPQLEDFGALEYHLLDELRDAGREAARAALAGTPVDEVLPLTGSAA
jgi:EmrB/QacA subfamily drug resistance transporter